MVGRKERRNKGESRVEEGEKKEGLVLHIQDRKKNKVQNSSNS